MIGLIALLLPLAMLLVMFLWGMFIGLKRTRIRFICVAASFVASLFLALRVKNVESGAVLDVLTSKFGSSELLTTILAEEGLCDALLHFGGAVVAPWVFCALFVAFCAISAVVCGILFLILRIGRRPESEDGEIDLSESGYIDLFGGYGLYGEFSLFGEFGQQAMQNGSFLRVAIYAVAQTLLTLFVFLTPVVSTVDFAPIVVDTVCEMDMLSSETQDKLLDTFDEIDKTPLVKAYRALGGNAICRKMSTFEVEGAEYYLNDEVGIIIDFVSNITKLTGKPIQEYTETEIEVLRAIDKDMHDSVFLPTVAGDLIYLVTDAWLDPSGSRAIFGMTKPTFDKDTTSMVAEPFEHILEAFHKDAHDLEALRADFDTLERTMEILINSGVIGSMNEAQTNQMVELLTQGDTIDLLLIEFDKNPSFEPLSDDITRIGMRAMGSTLKIPSVSGENYSQFTGELASKLNVMNGEGLTAEEQKEQLTTTIRETYSQQAGKELEVSDEVVGLYADVLIKEFEGKEDVTDEDLQKFFDSYAGIQSDDAQN